MTVTGTIAWFDLTKRFGFVALEGGHGDASQHMPGLKEAGYVWLSRGTTVRVRVEQDCSGGWPKFWRSTPALPGPGRTRRSGASPRPERVKLGFTPDQAQWTRR